MVHPFPQVVWAETPSYLDSRFANGRYKWHSYVTTITRDGRIRPSDSQPVHRGEAASSGGGMPVRGRSAAPRPVLTGQIGFAGYLYVARLPPERLGLFTDLRSQVLGP
jgi:hypothetical protein